MEYVLREHWARRQNHLTADRARDRTLHFVFDSRWHGLFAHVAKCLEFSHWARTQQRQAVFACVGGSYSVDEHRENWLAEILHQPGYDAPLRRDQLPTTDVIRLSTSFDVFPYWRYRVPSLTLAEGRRVFHETFQLAPAVSKSVAEVASGWSQYFMIGLHYRGTDKKVEALPVDFESVTRRLQQVLAALTERGVHNARIFVATDDGLFLEHIRAEFGALILTRDHVARSHDGRPIHLHVARGNRLAIDAMVDAVLLSRCAVLVRTASFLSGFSAMLAENQLVFMLNRPFAKTTWFPDLQVLESSIEFDDLRPALDRYLGRATAAAAQGLSSLTKLAPGRINDP